MKKWNVKISFVIRANTRIEAYKLVGELTHKHMRDLATIDAISRHELKDPYDWIAINEPIEARS